jgi:hypothetical protein
MPVSGFGRDGVIPLMVADTTTLFQSVTASAAAVPAPSHTKAMAITMQRVSRDLSSPH